MKTAAIYARVSSDKQKEEHTIASQTAGLIAFAQVNGYSVPPEWMFEDEGYSGASLVRPGLEKIRDLAAEGQIEAVLIHSPPLQSLQRYGLLRPSCSASVLSPSRLEPLAAFPLASELRFSRSISKPG